MPGLQDYTNNLLPAGGEDPRMTTDPQLGKNCTNDGASVGYSYGEELTTPSIVGANSSISTRPLAHYDEVIGSDV